MVINTRVKNFRVKGPMKSKRDPFGFRSRVGAVEPGSVVTITNRGR